jgi:hypothetical protein
MVRLLGVHSLCMNVWVWAREWGNASMCTCWWACILHQLQCALEWRDSLCNVFVNYQKLRTNCTSLWEKQSEERMRQGSSSGAPLRVSKVASACVIRHMNGGYWKRDLYQLLIVSLLPLTSTSSRNLESCPSTSNQGLGFSPRTGGLCVPPRINETSRKNST